MAPGKFVLLYVPVSVLTWVIRGVVPGSRGRIAIHNDSLVERYWLGQHRYGSQPVLFQGTLFGTDKINEALVVSVVQGDRTSQQLALVRVHARARPSKVLTILPRPQMLENGDRGYFLGMKFHEAGVANLEHSAEQCVLAFTFTNGTLTSAF